ncbi:phosphonoacetaldehyde hydrolase [Fusibacter paucivorans]|uniref:Phosphonoacetaldehyde hydrolase n=1 Tax=Fusibacter paucivorans TaxID=76009 RepID=A0ABS5PPF5_9FIRM|nr:phosphonoacetaldehyde hydrolase [Fusibacter paucivorans]MBS7526938.1 phosphonoacetaldehyde hydrolase [Fusibacter paucivorans]
MKKKTSVTAVIFDWAGTMVDFGCMAPVEALIKVFGEVDIELTDEIARRYMGMSKKEHIRKTLQLPEIESRWIERHDRVPGNEDVASLYNRFEQVIFDYLEDYATPVPGITSLIDQLRQKGIAIGSTTGYTKEMADTVKKAAETKGLHVDCCVTPDSVPAGRPSPWMCGLVAMKLDVYPPNAIVKIGDTVSDILEGKNAGMWSVGVIKGGSELGLTIDQIERLSDHELYLKTEAVRQKFLAAGADYVIDSIDQAGSVVEVIDKRLSLNEEGLR